MMAAREWGMTPYQFWALPKTEQALMIEFVFAKMDMTAYEDMVNRPTG